VIPPPEGGGPWWTSAVVYQIYPRSYLDTNGDGVGDLEGIRRRLDYLVDLGVDALWISPFYPSPMADFGYDVADYCDVDPLFGTLADFDRLLADAHQRGLRVLIDWVPNHTSDQHPWFVDSRSSRASAQRDWYVWRDPDPDDPSRPPNNWIASFTNGSAWSWDDATGQWYLHLFLPEQPDLNWANAAVEAAMHDVLRFWLDRGVDGFRMDVIHCVGKDATLPDTPAIHVGIPHSALNDDPSTHPLLRRLRELLDSYPGHRVMVGEVFLLSTAKVAQYYGQGDELHLAFNFPPLFAPWEAGAWRHRIERAIAELDPVAAWPTWVLSNHDNPRHRTRYGNSETRARAAAVLLSGLRGTPFLYAGEELGLDDAVIPPGRGVDPGGRDGCRAPIPWDASPSHGWGCTEPWLPWPPNADTVNAETLSRDPGSILGLYRRLLATRRASPALSEGTFAWLGSPDGVLAWERTSRADRRIILVNFTDAPTRDLANMTGLTVDVSSDGPSGEGADFSGRLDAGQAVIVR
jgi:alpha-glucosidase